MAMSKTVAVSAPVSTIVTVRSSSSPSTSVSVVRCSKRRMLTSPVVITWPESTLVTRVIGTKIRRRPSTSTTRPEHARRPVVDAERGDDVADLADLVAVRVEDLQARQSGDEDPGRCCAHGLRLPVEATRCGVRSALRLRRG